MYEIDGVMVPFSYSEEYISSGLGMSIMDWKCDLCGWEVSITEGNESVALGEEFPSVVARRELPGRLIRHLDLGHPGWRDKIILANDAN